METTFSETVFEESLSNVSTPTIDGDEWEYNDADDELRVIARHISNNVPHNSSIEPGRIKFLYTRKPKKDGGRFIIGNLTPRSTMEKMVNNDYDFIVIVYYQVWKELDIKNKVIQLDKLLCGTDVNEKEECKKRATDSREYTDNLNHFGPSDVLNSSEIVHMTTGRIIEEEKEKKRQAKKAEKESGSEGGVEEF